MDTKSESKTCSTSSTVTSASKLLSSSEWVSVPDEIQCWELVGVPKTWHIQVHRVNVPGSSRVEAWLLRCFHAGPHAHLFGLREETCDTVLSSGTGGRFSMGAQNLAFLWRDALLSVYTGFGGLSYQEWFEQYFISVHARAVEARQLVLPFHCTVVEGGEEVQNHEKLEMEHASTAFFEDLIFRTDRHAQEVLEAKSVQRQIDQALSPDRPTLLGIAELLAQKMQKDLEGPQEELRDAEEKNARLSSEPEPDAEG